VPILQREPDVHPADLFEPAPGGTRAAVPDAGAGRPWWVAHTRSRQEKLLARHLRARDVPCYLPQRERRTTSGGKVRTAHLPLFPGYVFLRGAGAERLAAYGSGVVVRLLEVPDQAAIERELGALWRLQSSGAPLVPWSYLGPGDEVEIVDGPLKGWTGIVLREKGSLRLVVSVTFLRQSVAAEVDREIVAPLTHRPIGGPARREGLSRSTARR
jgi:transcription antitermination factor NusG